MTDPLLGRDGTQALDGHDALAPSPRPARDAGPADARPADALAADPSSALPALPVIALPALPVATDPAAAARWAEDDAASARLATDPRPRAARTDWIDGEAVEPVEASATAVPVRHAGPSRVLPTPAAARPTPTRRPTGQRRPTGARRATPADRPAPRPAAPRQETQRSGARPSGQDPGPAAEPEWLRERREEHEFRSEFGEWRAGARPATRPTAGLRPGTVLVLLVVVAIVVIMVLS